MPDEAVVVAEVVKRRRFPWKVFLALFMAMPLVLAVVVWRIGWPAKSWETTVTPLEQISWFDAVKLRSDCIQPDGAQGGRSVLLAHGTLDNSGKPVFDFDDEPFGNQRILALRRTLIPELRLPDLSGKQFYAGVFWVDLPAEYEGEPADSLDPAAAYSVLLMCPDSKRWEETAELVVDLNRNRDLSDDPVMAVSRAWLSEGANPDANIRWSSRVFGTINLSRTPTEEETPADLPASVDAIPAFQVFYSDSDEFHSLALSLFPAFFRQAWLDNNGTMKIVIITPDATRFGRYDGPYIGALPVDGSWFERAPLTEWSYERGTFWGCLLDGEGRELRDGPYQGPTGLVRAETAGGEPMRISHLDLLMHGKVPHNLTSRGWAPIPRLSFLTFPVDEHPLPVGAYSLHSLHVAGKQGSRITVDTRQYSPEYSFTIRDGQATTFRLPQTLEMEAMASLDVLKPDKTYERIWSSKLDTIQSSNKALPQPGCEIDLEIVTTDATTGSRCTVYPGGAGSSNGLHVVIKDESGKVVNSGTMRYG